MIWIGVVIVLITFAAILKNYEARLVLILSGALMALVAGICGVADTFNGVFNAFTSQLISASLVPAICVCMGFSAVMDYTGCSASLVNILTAPMNKLRFALVPGAVIITWLINIVVMSASGCAATVGTLLIPMLISFGVHPATAAACILIGTWGNNMNPGQSFIIQVGELAGKTSLEVISGFTPTAIIALVVSAALLTIIDIVMSKRKNGKVAASDAAEVKKNDGEKNIIKALVPVLPIILLLLGNWGVLPNLDITVWMLLCAGIGMLTKIKSVQDSAKSLFNGMGGAYRDIITLMAAASVFTFGMSAIGLTDALVNLMKNSTAIAQLGAGFGPFIIAMLSGSGNAATIAFNGAITPFAPDFGYAIDVMGAVAAVAGALGRAASPVAGVTIICARMAGVSPMDVVKRALVPMLVATILFMIILL